MAHLIETMAYASETPWHGLGNQLSAKSPISVWAKQAGMEWQINESPLYFQPGEGTDHTSFDEQKVLYRSDTGAALSVVSQRFQVVQPRDVLEFYRDLTKAHGFTLETAGVLKGGRKVWALAKTNMTANIKGNDTMNGYLLLATGCDGTLATTAQFTSIRVVCNNTLQMSFNRNSGKRVSVRHNTEFNPNSVKLELGLNADEVYGSFLSRMRSFANKSISGSTAEEIVEAMFASLGRKSDIRESRGFTKVLDLFTQSGKGSQIDGVAGTGWGLINAVTEYADFHVRARNQEFRLDSSWFGAGRTMKETILELVEEV